MATPEDSTALVEGRAIVELERNEPQEAGSSGTDASGADWPDAEPPDLERLRIERQEQDALLASAQLIGAEALFDEAFYAAASGVGGGRGDLVTHYLTIGEPAFVSPSLEFDVRFYRDTNPDVVRSGGSALVHYLTHGRHERRYPNRRRLQRDAERVTASGLFDARVYAWDRGRPAQAGLSEAEDYLVARNHRAPIGQQFDGEFYARVYDDLSDPGFTAPVIPILHYIDIGRAQLRVCNDRQLKREIEAGRTRFNEHYYLDQFRNQFPDDPLPADPLRHYILTGNRLGLDPAPDFSGDYYLRRYPDLRVSGMTPFYHFAAHGHAEGRVGRPDFTSVTSAGQAAFDGGKPTLLLASHEASRTGAPLVGLNVGARLADTHNVISYLGRAGPLLRDFAAHSCLLVVAPLSPLDAEYLLLHLKATHRLAAVLLNSVETSNFAQAALQADLPSVALVHEFAEYTLPPGRMSEVIESVDRVITPATLIRDSVQAELLATRAGFANSIEVRPQGYLPRLPEDGAEDDLTREEILALIGADGSAQAARPRPRSSSCWAPAMCRCARASTCSCRPLARCAGCGAMTSVSSGSAKATTQRRTCNTRRGSPTWCSGWTSADTFFSCRCKAALIGCSRCPTCSSYRRGSIHSRTWRWMRSGPGGRSCASTVRPASPTRCGFSSATRPLRAPPSPIAT